MVQFFLGLTQQNPLTTHLLHELQPSTLPALDTHLKIYPVISVALLLLTVLFMTYGLIAFKPKSQFIKNLYQIEQQEYDFMGSQSSYHSQMDVASAMIDMQQMEAAEQIINDLKGRFIPGSELDEHLRAIMKKLKTSGVARNDLY
jgi:hypothetical protein